MGLGLLLALGAGRLLSSQLYDVSGTDPISFGGALAALSGAALVASYLPARRATKVNPMVALRCEKEKGSGVGVLGSACWQSLL